MANRIALVQGHPDLLGSHFCHALAEAYAEGARAAGRELRTIEVAQLTFPWLRNKQEFEHGPAPPDIATAQETLHWCDHLVIVFPMWLGQMPALLKAFLEQTLRPGFAHQVDAHGWKRLLRGRSARVVMTMGMPAPMYGLLFGAHGLKALERSVLGFCGFHPIRHSLVGSVERPDPSARRRWIDRMTRLGRDGR